MDITYALDDIRAAATEFLSYTKNFRVIALDGEMGAGKTTLVKAICKELGVKDLVSSPTFSLVNEYLLPNESIYHIDLYRLADEQEALSVGIPDLLESGNFCFVEWPQRAPGIFPNNTLWVNIEITPVGNRKIKVME